jgi:UDP-N-acetylmuramyl pentapeptide phosphotransferase/UDP-N-acetylglucosamine-1-phosphate transferase
LITALGASAFAGVATAVLCRPVVRWLAARRVLDVPVARSSHDTPTLRGGGIAPAIAMTLAGLGASVMAPRLGLAILWVAVCFGAIGTLEDLIGVDTGKRLLGQFAVAAVGMVPLVSPAFDRAGFSLGVAGVVVGVVWYVAFVNAFNFMDGINGISATQAIVAGTSWAAIGGIEREPVMIAFGGIIALASVAFLPWNFPVAKVFLGDAGSYFFGGWLAATAAVSVVVGTPAVAVGGPVAIYLCDTGVTLLRRALHGESLLEAHRDHVYQRLVRGGWSHTRTTLVTGSLMASTSLIGSIALIGRAWATPLAVVGIGCMALVYLAAPRIQRQRPVGPRAPHRTMVAGGLRHP